MVENLSANHTVIIFDNRGMGATTTTNLGSRSYSIEQLSNDTADFIDTPKIGKPVDVPGKLISHKSPIV
jgi:hypothetical protein